MTEAAKGEPTPPVSGLDMAPTIAWYTANVDALSAKLPDAVESPVPFPTTDLQFMAISSGEISALINMFPAQAIARSRLHNAGSINGMPSRYFSKESTSQNQIPTYDAAEALTPTAIIPSYINNARWIPGSPTGDIELYKIPDNVDSKVQRIIHAQGFVHEFAHSLTTQIFYSKSHKLRFPNGEVMEGEDFLIAFAKAAERHPPMSHYSGFFRKDGEEFKNELAIEEDFVESVTAYLLGFTFSADEGRRMNPLQDRPEIRKMIDDFLHAELTA